MIRRWTALAVGLWAVGAQAIDTTENRKFDLILRSAVVAGTVTQDGPDPDRPTLTIGTPIKYGGMLIGFGVNYDLMRWFSLGLGAHFILDLAQGSITRKGLEITAGFHLLGGARRIMTETDDMSLMERDPYALTFLVRPGFQSYTPASAATAAVQVDASLIAMDMGLEYRIDAGEGSSISLAFLYSLISLPASVPKAKSALMTIEASWHIFL